MPDKLDGFPWDLSICGGSPASVALTPKAVLAEALARREAEITAAQDGLSRIVAAGFDNAVKE